MQNIPACQVLTLCETTFFESGTHSSFYLTNKQKSITNKTRHTQSTTQTRNHTSAKGAVHDIPPFNQTPNAAACAEHSLFLVLSLLRHYHAMDSSLAQRMLGYPLGTSLSEKKVLIVGFGDSFFPQTVCQRKFVGCTAHGPVYQAHWGVRRPGDSRLLGRGSPAFVTGYGLRATEVSHTCILDTQWAAHGIIGKSWLALDKGTLTAA